MRVRIIGVRDSLTISIKCVRHVALSSRVELLVWDSPRREGVLPAGDIRGKLERDVGPDGRVAGTRHGPRAEETRVGEMEGPWIAQYVRLSPMSWMGVDDVTSAVCVYYCL